MIGSALQRGYEPKRHIFDIAPRSTREFPIAKLLRRRPLARWDSYSCGFRGAPNPKAYPRGFISIAHLML